MSISAIIPVAKMLAANLALEELGHGPNNFSIPCYAGASPTHAVLHCWSDPVFEAHIAAQDGVIIQQSIGGTDAQGDPIPELGTGDPVTDTNTLVTSQGAKWAGQFPEFPAAGMVTANTMYRYTDGTIWWVIQGFNRTTYPAPPSELAPALITQVRDPNVVYPWKQPLYQWDSYNKVNTFTGEPDECLHNGKLWVTSRDTNVWEPGTSDSGWYEKGTGAPVEPPVVDEYPAYYATNPNGTWHVYAKGDKMTFTDGKRYISTIGNNTYTPVTYPAGWQVQP